MWANMPRSMREGWPTEAAANRTGSRASRCPAGGAAAVRGSRVAARQTAAARTRYRPGRAVVWTRHGTDAPRYGRAQGRESSDKGHERKPRPGRGGLQCRAGRAGHTGLRGWRGSRGAGGGGGRVGWSIRQICVILHKFVCGGAGGAGAHAHALRVAARRAADGAGLRAVRPRGASSRI